MGLYRDPNEIERELLALVVSVGQMSHDDERLARFCSDDSTLTHPDVFNACHDLEWLFSRHNHDTSQSWVAITDAGRKALST